MNALYAIVTDRAGAGLSPTQTPSRINDKIIHRVNQFHVLNAKC